MTDPIILSYGMGVDSTAILLRWIAEPETRDFPLSRLTVLTAMTGDEFPETGELVAGDILPLLRDAGVRYVQIARRSASQADGVAVLSDSRLPYEVHLEGAGWKLSDEMATAGTIPQVASGKRVCTQHFKGWPLDTWLEGEMGVRPFRHVIGYNADELFRRDRDQGYAGEVVSLNRIPEYPLIEWGWGRQACEDYIFEQTGVRWPKSCCTFCPFAKDHHLDRYRQNPDAAVAAMLMEHTSLALNPRSTLFAKHSVIKLVEDDGNVEAMDRFYHQLGSCTYAAYDVRRILFAKGGDPAKKGPAARSVQVRARGTHMTAAAALRGMAVGHGTTAYVDKNGLLRATILEREDTYPTCEHELVVAPAGVAPKQRAGFETSWSKVMASRTQERQTA